MYRKYTEKMMAFEALLQRRYKNQSVLWCKFFLHKLKGTQEFREDCIWVSWDLCCTTLHWACATLHYIRPSEKL